MIRVCSHQPSFLPWVGFWNKLAQCDLYVALAGVTFATHDYQNRVKLAGSWLTLPLDKSTRHLPLYQVKVRDTKAAAVSLEKTLHCRRYPYYNRIASIVEYLKNPETDSLLALNMVTTQKIEGVLGWGSRLHTALYMGAPKEGLSKTENLLDHVGHFSPVSESPVVYYAGGGALAYLNLTELGGLKVRIQEMKSGIADETILQLIAREPDPVDVVMNAATWRPL